MPLPNRRYIWPREPDSEEDKTQHANTKKNRPSILLEDKVFSFGW